MEQEKTIAILDLFATSRTGIDVASDQVIGAVKAGEVNPLKALVWCKSIEEIVERVRKETKENQLREADKYAEKSFAFAGATLTKAEHNTRYDFTACGDVQWERLDAEIKNLIERRKIREDFLKSLKEPMNIVSEDGEAVTIHPPVKTSVSGLNVSIK